MIYFSFNEKGIGNHNYVTRNFKIIYPFLIIGLIKFDKSYLGY